MTSLMNRLSLYDMLSMVIPGYLTLFLSARTFAIKVSWPDNSLIYVVVTFCASYVIGLVIHRISRWVFGWLRHNSWLNNAAHIDFLHDLAKREEEIKKSHDDKLSQEWYYRTFYTLWKDASLSHIPPLEAQLSFCRSLCIVGVLYLLMGWRFISECWIMSAITLGSITCFIIMMYTRRRIYYYYFEAEHYLVKQKQQDSDHEAPTDSSTDTDNRL